MCLQVMVWNLNTPEQVIKNPVRSISVHPDVVLSMSFNTDGSRIATSCKDKKIRIIDPRTGTILQVCVCVCTQCVNSNIHTSI